MAGYEDTRQMIINTLTNRLAGTEIQPEDHQEFALAITDYVRSVELLSGNAFIGFAEANTTPIQSDKGQCFYISTVGPGQTVNFVNFIDSNGNAISVSSPGGKMSLVTLIWNTQYWSSQVTTIDTNWSIAQQSGDSESMVMSQKAVTDAIAEEINKLITTDRIEDGAVTIGKLESSIQSLITNISKNATFAGIATPTTNPGTPEGPVFYFATQAGTYANFGGIEVIEGEASILQWSNGAWSKKVTGFATQEKLSELEKGVLSGVPRINKDIIQLYDGTTAIHPRTKAEAVFFDNDTSKTLAIKMSLIKTILGTDDVTDKSSSIASWNDGIINKTTGLPDSSFSAFCYAVIDVQKGDLIIRNSEGNLPLTAAAVSKVSGSGTSEDPYVFIPDLVFESNYSGYRYYVETSGKIAIQARYPRPSTEISWVYASAQIVRGQIADYSIGESSIINKSITKEKIADDILNELPRFSFGYDEFVNSVIKEIYFTPASLSYYSSWDDLYIVLTRKDYGADHSFGIGLSPNETTTTYKWFWSLNADHSICGDATRGVYIVVDWDKIPNDQSNYVGKHHRISISRAKVGEYSPAIKNYLNYKSATISAMNAQTNTDFANLCKSIGTTPMATWVDDDGVVSGYGGKTILSIVEPITDELEIPVTFALITPLQGNVVVDKETMTKTEYFKRMQRKGHHITAHPNHNHWYGDGYDAKVVESSLIDTMIELRKDFLHSELLVYPGSSSAIPEVVNIVRKWCPCGVIAGYGTPNHLADTTKWQIKRTFVDFAGYYNSHHSDVGFVSAMQWYKDQVDYAYENGDWIVFGTHCYLFSTSTDTSDPNASTYGNLRLLMQYTKDKGIKFYTLYDAYNRRKALYDFKEINE